MLNFNRKNVTNHAIKSFFLKWWNMKNLADNHFKLLGGFLNLILETMINEHIRTFWTGLGDHTNSLTLFKFLNFRTLSFCTTRENYSIVFKTNDAQVQCFYEYIQALQLRFRLPQLHIVFTVANAIMHVSRTTISWHIFN